MDELRARLRRVEHDVAAARILAGGADRDVGEIRGELREFRAQNTRLHNATRADLTDLRRDLTDLREHVDRGFAQFGEQFAQVDRNFLTVTAKIDGVAAGLQMITDLLTRREGDDPPGS